MLTASQSFRLYEIVNRYFTKEDDAKTFVSEIEAAIEQKYESERDRLATKADISLIGEWIAGLETKLAEQKADVMKWMILLFAPFYVGMIVFLIKQFL